MSNKEKIIIGSVAAVVILAIVLLFVFGRKAADPHPYKITLEVWGPIDDSDAFTEIFATYKTLNPQIAAITYKKISYDTYKQELVDAMASGQGPDILLINNSWLPSFQDKIVPASAAVFSEQTFKQNFVDVCAQDFFASGAVWAAPLSANSLALYYNKSLFNEAGITSPPTDWNQFVDDAKRLTKINNSNNQITQSGAALGTTANINRPTDILSLLLLQGGSPIVDSTGKVTLNDARIINGENYSSAASALNFYTNFANTSASNYSWNSQMHYSIDAFSEGSLAMMLNYSWQIPVIQSKSPKLNFGIAPVPQLSGSSPIDYANYWGFAVAKNKISPQGITNTIRTGEAWNLIRFMTTKPEHDWVAPSAGLGGGAVDPKFDPAANYLLKTEQPAARRDLIEKQKTDPEMSAFVSGNLIAKSWYQKDPDADETILTAMIDQVNKGEANVADALTAATEKIAQTMKVSN